MTRRAKARAYLAHLARALSRPRAVRTVCSECRCVHKEN